MTSAGPPASVVIVGYGAVGQALTPLLRDRFGLSPERVTAISPCHEDIACAAGFGLRHKTQALTPGNFADILAPLLAAGDWLINVSVNVSSIALIGWCQSRGVHYLDTCIEPWPGQYGSPRNPAGSTNFSLRTEALALHRQGTPTAVVAHGANPGLISHLMRAGLRELARLRGVSSWGSWAELACRLGIRVMQVAERDGQEADVPATHDHFYNTWSVDGFLAEAMQYAELGWGTHETGLPENGRRFSSGDDCAIYLDRHSAEVKVRSWVPSAGEQWAYLITHHEAISMADLLTLRTPEGIPTFRPTVYYAYRPSPLTCASMEHWTAGGLGAPAGKTVLAGHLVGGFNQLGVLFVFPGGAYWYGSTLTLAQARAVAPQLNATTLQVAAGVIGALAWLQRHPDAGVVEAESMDDREVLAVAAPYLGDVSGVPSTWQPRPGSALCWRDFEVASGSKDIRQRTAS